MRPRNSEALTDRLRAGGVAVKQRAYPKLGHVSILLALARPFRGRGPVLADVAGFIRSTVNVDDTDRRCEQVRSMFAEADPEGDVQRRLPLYR